MAFRSAELSCKLITLWLVINPYYTHESIGPEGGLFGGELNITLPREIPDRGLNSEPDAQKGSLAPILIYLCQKAEPCPN
jgi:hypothetical protein